MKNNFYEIVKNNEERESELKGKRRKEEDLVDEIRQKQSYYKFKYLVTEFSCFINEVVKNYGNLDANLTNMTLDNVKITYSKYEPNYNKEVLTSFLRDYDLGELRDNYIVWNSKKTIKDFIDSYNKLVYKYEDNLYISCDLRELYLQLVLKDKEEYEPLLTDEFKNFMNLYSNGIDENISAKVYYYVQSLLEKRNYDLKEFDTRDFSDFYENPNWDKWNPDYRLTHFLSSVAKMNSYIDRKEPLDVESLGREYLEILIEDINTLKKDEETLFTAGPQSAFSALCLHGSQTAGGQARHCA